MVERRLEADVRFVVVTLQLVEFKGSSGFGALLAARARRTRPPQRAIRRLPSAFAEVGRLLSGEGEDRAGSAERAGARRPASLAAGSGVMSNLVSSVVALVVLAVALSFADVRAGDCEPDWQPAFGAPAGTDGLLGGRVRALLTFDDGSGQALYVGGHFDVIDGQPIGGIARWDGTNWSAVGDGLHGVRALAVYDDGSGPALYAAGDFHEVGGQPGGKIARWNGESWSPVGGGIVGPGVHALAVYDDGSGEALYAAGDFWEAGGQPATNIARWNGTQWSALGSGISGHGVSTLAVHDPGTGKRLYVGGFFHFAGGAPSSYVARWNGQWSHGGTGIDAPVEDFAVFDAGDGPAVYATSDAGTDGAALYRLSGTQWQPVGGSTLTSGHGLAVRERNGVQELLVGGDFEASFPSDGVAIWDGSTWSALGDGVSGVVSAFAEFDGGGGEELWVGGSFETAGGLVANDLATWDGASWSTPTPSGGFEGAVRSLVEGDLGAGERFFAGGSFLVVDGQPVRRIAAWDGAAWTEVGGGVDGDVLALALGDLGDGMRLYAGGRFSEAGGVPAAHVAAWDGAQWSPLGLGTDADVRALALFDDGDGVDLYAAGDFGTADGLLARRIARWDGSAWSPLANGVQKAFGSPPYARSLAVFDDGQGEALYVGGDFTHASGKIVLNIARWDGTSWSALAGGVGKAVDALAVFDAGGGPALYAGGAFKAASGVEAHRVVRWDGMQWSSVGSGTDSDVTALAVFDDGRGPALFAGGLFGKAGGVDAQRVARWDGTSWSALGPGLTGAPAAAPIEVLAVHDDGRGARLFAGGEFLGSAAGDAHLASWGGCPDGSPWTDLGGGTAGIAGVPALTLSGSLEPGSLLALDLVDGAPSSLAVLFVSLASTPAPFLGGTLHALPFSTLVVLVTDPDGELHGATSFPGGPLGQGLWFQVGIADASVPVYGASLANGVAGVIP